MKKQRKAFWMKVLIAVLCRRVFDRTAESVMARAECDQHHIIAECMALNGPGERQEGEIGRAHV